jgi:hypothetical protein
MRIFELAKFGYKFRDESRKNPHGKILLKYHLHGWLLRQRGK